MKLFKKKFAFKIISIIGFLIAGYVFLTAENFVLADGESPADLVVSSVGTQSATLSWSLNYPTVDLGKWIVRHSSDGATVGFEADVTPTTTYSYTFTGLTPNTPHYFAVAAYYVGEVSVTSTFTTSSLVTTLASRPGYSPPLVSVEESNTNVIPVVSPTPPAPEEVVIIPDSSITPNQTSTVPATEPIVTEPVIEKSIKPFPDEPTSSLAPSINLTAIDFVLSKPFRANGGMRTSYRYNYRNTAKTAKRVTITREVIDDTGKVVYRAEANQTMRPNQKTSRVKYQTFYPSVSVDSYMIRITVSDRGTVLDSNSFTIYR